MDLPPLQRTTSGPGGVRSIREMFERGNGSTPSRGVSPVGSTTSNGDQQLSQPSPSARRVRTSFIANAENSTNPLDTPGATPQPQPQPQLPTSHPQAPSPLMTPADSLALSNGTSSASARRGSFGEDAESLDLKKLILNEKTERSDRQDVGEVVPESAITTGTTNTPRQELSEKQTLGSAKRAPSTKSKTPSKLGGDSSKEKGRRAEEATTPGREKGGTAGGKAKMERSDSQDSGKNGTTQKQDKSTPSTEPNSPGKLAPQPSKQTEKHAGKELLKRQLSMQLEKKLAERPEAKSPSKPTKQLEKAAETQRTSKGNDKSGKEPDVRSEKLNSQSEKTTEDLSKSSLQDIPSIPAIEPQLESPSTKPSPAKANPQKFKKDLSNTQEQGNRKAAQSKKTNNSASQKMELLDIATDAAALPNNSAQGATQEVSLTKPDQVKKSDTRLSANSQPQVEGAPNQKSKAAVGKDASAVGKDPALSELPIKVESPQNKNIKKQGQKKASPRKLENRKTIASAIATTAEPTLPKESDDTPTTPTIVEPKKLVEEHKEVDNEQHKKLEADTAADDKDEDHQSDMPTNEATTKTSPEAEPASLEVNDSIGNPNKDAPKENGASSPTQAATKPPLSSPSDAEPSSVSIPPPNPLADGESTRKQATGRPSSDKPKVSGPSRSRPVPPRHPVSNKGQIQKIEGPPTSLATKPRSSVASSTTKKVKSPPNSPTNTSTREKPASKPLSSLKETTSLSSVLERRQSIRPLPHSNHLTAPTASSKAKQQSNNASANSSATFRKPAVTKREPMTDSSSGPGKGTLPKRTPRASLPAQTQAKNSAPTIQRPTSRSSLRAEDFLSRIMRPTASSSKKAHGKVEVKSPPRRAASVKSPPRSRKLTSEPASQETSPRQNGRVFDQTGPEPGAGQQSPTANGPSSPAHATSLASLSAPVEATE